MTVQTFVFRAESDVPDEEASAEPSAKETESDYDFGEVVATKDSSPTATEDLPKKNKRKRTPVIFFSVNGNGARCFVLITLCL